MIEAWKQLDEHIAYNGWRKIIRRTYELPDGSKHAFDVKQEGNPVCVLALTSDQHVILAKQFRVGPNKVLFELPGGGTEKGESFEHAVTRELLEETGYEGNIQLVGTSLVDGYSTGLRYNFVATDCKKVAEPKVDPAEPIEAALMPLADFRKHLRSGELTDVTTAYLGLDHLGLL